MENELTQYGGTVGALVIIVMMLVKELRARMNGKERINPSSLMTKDLCLERHGNLEKKVDKIDHDIERLTEKIDELPRKLNGGLKP